MAKINSPMKLQNVYSLICLERHQRYQASTAPGKSNSEDKQTIFYFFHTVSHVPLHKLEWCDIIRAGTCLIQVTIYTKSSNLGISEFSFLLKRGNLQDRSTYMSFL